MNIALAALLLAAGCGDGVEVQRAGGGFDVAARNAPVSRVIECLAEKAGFRIVIEPGVALDQSITVQLAAQTPAAAIRGILEGQRLNYAYTTDRTATRVLMLMISARAAGAPEPKDPPPLIRSVPPATPGLRNLPPPPVAEDEVETSAPPAIRGAPPTPTRGRGAGAPPADPGSEPRPSTEIPLYPSPRPLSPMTLSDAGRVRPRPIG